jgi:hypothetical protein
MDSPSSPTDESSTVVKLNQLTSSSEEANALFNVIYPSNLTHDMHHSPAALVSPDIQASRRILYEAAGGSLISSFLGAKQMLSIVSRPSEGDVSSASQHPYNGPAPLIPRPVSGTRGFVLAVYASHGIQVLLASCASLSLLVSVSKCWNL